MGKKCPVVEVITQVPNLESTQYVDPCHHPSCTDTFFSPNPPHTWGHFGGIGFKREGCLCNRPPLVVRKEIGKGKKYSQTSQCTKKRKTVEKSIGGVAPADQGGKNKI